MPTIITLIQYNAWVLSQENKVRDRKGRNQTILICKWDDSILQRPEKLQ
jgi:hypothetical protein